MAKQKTQRDYMQELESCKYEGTTQRYRKKHELTTGRSLKREREHREEGRTGNKNTRVKHGQRQSASQLLDKLKGPARLEISHLPFRTGPQRESTEEREKRHHHYPVSK